MKRGPLVCFLILSISFLLGLIGCTSARVEISGDQKLSDYHKVYLMQTGQSEPILQTNIYSRLKKCGFDVVEIKSGNGPTGGQGTGFVLTDDGNILTCAHVLGLRTNATVWIHGRRYVGRVAAVDTNVDAAVIKVDAGDQKFQPLPFIWNVDYKMGDDVYTMGFPMAALLGNSPRLTKGLISSTVGLRDDPKTLQISAEVQPGNSGGPLLNEKGEAIGMVNATLNALNVLLQTGGTVPQNVNFAIKSSTIQEFLGEHVPSVPLVPAKRATNGLDAAKDSIVLVRAGIVEDDDLKARALVCSYFGRYDPVLRERLIAVMFTDAQTSRVVIEARADSQKYRTIDAVDRMLNQIFAQIYLKFFPDKRNPF